MKRAGCLISKYGSLITVMLTVVLFSILFSDEAFAMLTATVNHDHIAIDFFYHGNTISIRGVSEPGVDLIINMTAPDEHQALKKKGRVAGILWMNIGTLKFEHVPNFYAVYSSKKLEDILIPAELEKYTLGYAALERHVEVIPVANEEEKAKWFSEFIKFKENSKVYAVTPGKIDIIQNSDGKQNYSIMMDWPYQAQPGDYPITVYAVKDGKVVDQVQSKVKVEQVGVVKTLATMAKDNPAFYGILSIGIALGAGFGVSLVFRKGGGSH